MQKGDLVKLKMQKVLQKGLDKDAEVYCGTLVEYGETEGCIYISLQQDLLPKISLDAIYRCEISSETKSTWCTGRIGERYLEKGLNIVKLKVENGFYKINIK